MQVESYKIDVSQFHFSERLEINTFFKERMMKTFQLNMLSAWVLTMIVISLTSVMK